MRHFQAVINQECLLASSPHEVARFFKERASKPDEIGSEKDADEELELVLFQRKEPLITLSLAKYATSEVVSLIFASARESDAYSRALRLSVLSNESIGMSLFSRFSTYLFKEESSLLSYLSTADLEEISALFQNKTMDDLFLRDFLEGKESWACMSEDRHMAALDALFYNERIITPYDESFMDGYAEFSYGAVFDAVWKLSERLPVTIMWAARLGRLFDRVLADSFSIEKPLEVAQRWRTSGSDQKAIETEIEENDRGYLSYYQSVRKGLGRLALSKSPILAELLMNEDPAFRCAAYCAGKLSPEQISVAFERDGELFFNEAVHNNELWRRLESREALHDVAWAVVRNDKLSDLMAANIFNGIKERMEKMHPDWFKDEDYQPEIEGGDEQVTKDDLHQAVNNIAYNTASVLEQLKQSIITINKQINRMWWFVLGAAAVWLLK